MRRITFTIEKVCDEPSSESGPVNPRHYLTRRRTLSAEPPFDLAGLKAVFATEVLPGPKKLRIVGNMPDDENLGLLASILNFWHLHFYDAQEKRNYNGEVDKAAAAVEALLAILPRIEAHHRPLAKRGAFFSRAMADATVDLRVALERDPKRVLWREDAPDQIYGWQWLAGVLPSDFAKVWQSANNYKPGIETNGPLARFLEKVIPSVTGEHPIRASIHRRLSEIKAETKAAEGG